MSSSISPIFKLNFEQTNGTLTDLCGNGYDATVNSTTACTPVADDPEMGRCMLFDGTSDCTINQGLGNIDLSNGLTICAWVNMASYPNEPKLLALYDGTTQQKINIQLADGAPYYWNSQTSLLKSSITLTKNVWHHVAVTVSLNGETKIYVDGSECGIGTETGYEVGANFTLSNIEIAAKGFNGMMAWMALYDGPLGQADILADMAEGQAKRAASFRQSMPIDFKLYSDDGGAESPIMFIEDEGAGEDLNLRIVNNSHKPISISKSDDPVSSTNYHFQLHFRPGVLSKNFLSNYSEDSNAKKNANLPKLLANNPNWTAVVNGDTSGTDTISFLYDGTSALAIAKEQDHLIAVSAVNASATGGSRNTNVELRYDNIQLGGAITPIKGQRKQNISIVNHSGEKEISLRAEIIGNASVMTYAQPADGSTVKNPPQSELLFRVVNTGIKPIALALPDNPVGASFFTLSIAVQPENHLVEWALVSQGILSDNSVVLNNLGSVREVKDSSVILEGPLIEALATSTSLNIGGDSFSVAAPGAMAGDYQIPLTTSPASIQKGAAIQLPGDETTWTTAAVASSNTPPNTQQWTITNQSVKQLAPGAGLSFMLKDIECSLPAGSSVVTIEYHNIPGHWDGQFELPVEKSPMAFNQNLIGINIQDPKGSLHIEEENDYTPIIIGQKSQDDSTYISSERISIASKSLNENAGLILPYPESATKNGIVIGDNTGLPGAGLSVVINEDVDPLMIFKSGQAKVVVDQNGSVGIGTGNPIAPLHVATYKSFVLSNYYYLNTNAGGNPGYVPSSASYNVPTGIYCEAAIQATEFDAKQFSTSSDVRIKDFVQPSAAAQDLATLLRLQVSDYQYIDIVKHGATEKKGLIAQRVKEVFPQAVNSEKTDFIPDIYVMATDLGWQPVTRHLRVSLEKAHDLKVGDTLRLIAEKGFEEKKVVAIPDEQSFVVAEWEKPVEQLFVFGKEVHDFHTVDYDQVAMLGVSAIQALHQKLETSDQKSAALENRVEALEKENSRLKLQLEEELNQIRQELREFKAAVSTTHEN